MMALQREHGRLEVVLACEGGLQARCNFEEGSDGNCVGAGGIAGKEYVRCSTYVNKAAEETIGRKAERASGRVSEGLRG
jgi:hypothetical protein